MSTVSRQQLQILRSAVEHTVPICQGTLLASNDALTIFYGKGLMRGTRLDLAKASPAQIQELTNACDAATFGVDQKDVLDESYRKAVKMDASDFAVKLGDVVSDIVRDVVRPVLVGDGTREVRTELYKLNVYGQGSFFKAHKDTPRSREMFASLVIVFPVAHSGGALVFRHKTSEWTVDAAKLLSLDAASANADSEAARPQIAFVAFHSDIEHEVLPVESGHRVTVTYNLYYDSTGARSNGQKTEIDPSSSTERVFEDALKAMLADAAFLADGGYLGFGLRHLYAFSHKEPARDDMLKGTDAMIQRVCLRLGLTSGLKVFYDTDNSEVLMMDRLADLDSDYQYEGNELEETMVDQGVIVQSEDEGRVQKQLFWVNQAVKKNKAGTPYIAYGNEASLDYVYGEFNLVVRVGPFGDRKSAPRGD